ncbi:CBN-NHR-210 protein [Caenorhabditis brenneri]|uniref:CBN-NHR-210 protein n=1 Tax=Caenorhabditis brenneri TaxID=135651 RepID=G0PLK5_CAEBE|nr:CBN-NHR-210 protein [Caenorhabditis brenneri]
MQPCQVCGVTGSFGFHFGVISCRACAAFFRRAAFSKYRNSKCRSSNCDQKTTFCKPCRLQKCFEAGMETSNFQYHRDSLHDSKSAIVLKKSAVCKPVYPKIPQTFECFVGRPEMILFWDPETPTTHKTYIDVNCLIEEASKIFKQPIENVHVTKSRLHRLSIGLKVVRGNVKNYRFVSKMTQKEVSDTWRFYFLAVAKWLTHFAEFDELDANVKLTILQSMWNIWSVLDHHSAGAIHRKNNPNAPKTQTVSRRGTMMDMSNVHFDATWLSDYPSRQISGFFRNPFSPSNITETLMELQPTDMEMTFMLAQLSFEYAGKRCQGEIMNITEYFQSLLANDLHDYYMKELKMDNYFDRLAKLMKVNNAIQKKLWEARPRIELAKVFNLIRLEFSHPDMFKDTGFN